MAQFETWLKSDLQQPVKVIAVHGNVFTQDNMANRVGVEVTDGGEAVTLSGSVQGYIIRADDATVVQTGSLSGNKAWVDLPESAYAVPGQIQIAIRLVSGQTKTVLGACTGYVVRSVTSTIIDPGEVVPDIADLLAMIAECEAATDGAENVNITQTKTGNEITITTTDRDGVQTANTISGGSPVITDTASGAIASFPDGADGEPMESVNVGIEPVQDLHGYDNPWPGGGGKNKVGTFEYGTVSEGTAAGATYDQVKLARNDRARSTVLIPTPSQFTVSMDFSTYRFGIMFFDANQLYLGSTTGWRGWLSSANTYTPTNSAYVALVFRRTDNANLTEADFANCKIQLEFNSSATAYAPYSNICPITGWTGANVYRTGVNVWDEEWEVGGINNTTGANATGTATFRSKNYIPIISGQTYDFYNGANDTIGLRFYDASKNYIGAIAISLTNMVLAYGGQYLPSNTAFLRFVNTSRNSYQNNISVNYPSTDKAYHAYTGTTYPIAFTQAGTVYGGVVDVVSGQMTVDRAIATENSFISVAGNSSGGGLHWAETGQSVAKVSDRTISNMFPYVAGGSAWSSTTPCFQARDDGALRVYMPEATIANFKSVYQGLTIAYYLPTPVTYHLTPTQITSLLGQNNVWADTGNTAVTYKADTKLYIDKKLSALIAQIVNA